MKTLIKIAAASCLMGALMTGATTFGPSAYAQTQMGHTESEQMTRDETPNINADFNTFLAKYVTVQGDINLVRYADVTEGDKALLDGYIDALSRSGPPEADKNAIMAYWFNLYNAKTVSVIVDNYPVKSIKDIGGGLFGGGPWKKKLLTVQGKAVSLDDIEHGTVRAAYDEPRVHYAFNCASIGCPNLKTSAWEAAALDADLTQAAKDYVGSSRGVSVDSKGRITASNIYKWYKEDFGGSEQGILSHLAQYADGETKDALKASPSIRRYDYDWSLNIAK